MKDSLENSFEKSLQLTSTEICPNGIQMAIIRDASNKLRFIEYIGGIRLEYNPSVISETHSRYLSKQACLHQRYNYLLEDMLQESYKGFYELIQKESEMETEADFETPESSELDVKLTKFLDSVFAFLFNGYNLRKEFEEEIKFEQMNLQDYHSLNSALIEGQNFVNNLKERHYSNLNSWEKGYLDEWQRIQENIVVTSERLATTSEKKLDAIKRHMQRIYPEKIERSSYL